jgi:hypothetical protein
MIRWTHRRALLTLCMAAFCVSLSAQTQNTITVRMLDAKTGHLMQSSNFLVRANHQETVHGDWTRQKEDGTAELKLPPEAVLLSIHATYDSAMEIYVNCDSANEKENPVDRWYKISEILASGLVAPNACRNPHEVDKLKITAKPGEFVFFVRKANWREHIRDYAQ